ncbi:membrane-associated oxidoreductase [Streptomyces sp. NA02950]|uniref:membrane-associated oxidoreductase n=1 Tax=Streptomyces sp. NA02950 TaxID=2742137 RepID=UPI001592A132|nr:membrane-associated oxidoreductase [Streptomyces sp. NA02950]QKV94031.1 membrane-associated oxidoreductase [Streptomyces sp. NA02950]
MEITDLTPAERRVWDAFPLGESVDFRDSDEAGPEPGTLWGPERTVRARVLRALLLDGPVRDGEIPALKVLGAHITGRLDLRYGTVEHAVRLRYCVFESVPVLYGAQFRTLVLSHSVLPGLTAGAIRVDGALRMTGCRFTDRVRLAGAHVGGAVFLDGTRLESPLTPAVPDPGEPPEAVLELNQALIGHDLIARGLVAHGLIRLNGATVAGDVNFDDAHLLAPGRTALHAENLTVGTDLRGMRMRARGRVNLSGARIPRHLNFAYVRLCHPEGQALRASSATIGELWLREAAPIEGVLNLRGAQLDLFHIAPEVWPDRVRIDGLSYRSLTPHLPAEQRLPLLEHEEGSYLPYAYEQLTTAYRTAGDDAAARTVQLAKLRRHRRTLPRHARLWGHLQDLTVGYGFRPMRAAGWLLALLLGGALTFALHHPHPLKPDEAPEFNALFYTVDLLLPIIGFGQESAFAPQGWYQWLSYTLIVTGWILATTIAAGISRSLSRQ